RSISSGRQAVAGDNASGLPTFAASTQPRRAEIDQRLVEGKCQTIYDVAVRSHRDLILTRASLYVRSPCSRSRNAGRGDRDPSRSGVREPRRIATGGSASVDP